MPKHQKQAPSTLAPDVQTSPRGSAAQTIQNAKPKGRQGFASMTPERRKEIANKGGRAAHAQGLAHRFTSEEAKEAGKKGGRATQAKGAGHRWTIEEAQEAGRKGGKATQAKAASDETVVKGTVEVATPTIVPRITHATFVRDDGSRLVVTPKTVRTTGKAAADLVRALGGAGGSGVRR
jgi:general stress protein YciG